MAVHKYLKRLEYVHIIYRDNEDIDRESIENETSKYLAINWYICMKSAIWLASEC